MTPADYLFVGLLCGFIVAVIVMGSQHKAGWDAGRKAADEKWIDTTSHPEKFVKVDDKYYFAVWFDPNALEVECQWQDNGDYPPTNGQEYAE